MFLWRPAAGSGPAVLLIQEIFGVGAYIRAVAERLAAAGYVVGAPDVFWRFAPHWAATHDEAGLTASMEAVAQLNPETAITDCVAALDNPRRAARRHRHACRSRLLPRRHPRLGRGRCG